MKKSANKSNHEYWLIILNDGSQRVVKADNVDELCQKISLSDVLLVMNLNGNIFENLSEM